MPNIYEEYEPYYCNETSPKCSTKGFIINKEKREIINKDEIFALGTAMQRKYASAFMKKGTIKFGSPSKWMAYPENMAPERGVSRKGFCCISAK